MAFAVAGMAVGGCAIVPREPANLSLLKEEIRRYVESGTYERDIAAVAMRASSWIEQRAAKRGAGERLAIVFDLDETLLSNWPHIGAQDFGYVPAGWDEWMKEGRAPAIEPVREVYRTARRLGVEVVFLTGRREKDRPGTEKNLRAIDCADYAALVCKPNETQETTGAFKLRERKRLVAEGRAIIANVGDQESDLAGGYAERTFKLPNPLYLTK
ncbi:MAG: HAD family acid phosphatase [Opitutaceae bacterium]